jgi:hypothetical protein
VRSQNAGPSAKSATFDKSEPGAGLSAPLDRQLQIEPDGLIDFVVSRNLHRRHLNDHQRKVIAGKIVLKRAEDRRSAISREAPAAENPVSVETAANLLNVSEKEVENVTHVLRKGVPELATAMEAQKVSIATADKLASEPPKTQRAVLGQGVEAVAL